MSKIIHILILRKKVNDKDPKFKIRDHVRISKYKTFLLKDTFEIGLKNFLLLIKLKMQFHGHMQLIILMVKKLLEHFMKKNRNKLIKKNSELKKYLRKKVIYVKWKGYNNSFNSWIDKKDLV